MANDERRVDSLAMLQQALLGHVIKVDAPSPHGDFELYYDDGRHVTIDCGWAGATVHVARGDVPCPGCGCRPGDGRTDGCEHPDGCGFFKLNEREAEP